MANFTVTVTDAGGRTASASGSITTTTPSPWPTQATTGVPVGTVLTNSGGINSSADGQVIQNKNVTGGIVITHKNVTVKNCKVTPNLTILGTGAIIDHCELIGGTGGGQDSCTVLAANATVRNCYLHSAENVMWLEGSGSLIEGNYWADVFWQNGRHGDDIQVQAFVSNCTIRNNNFDGPLNKSSCMQMDGATNFIIDHNRFSGGTYSLYLLNRNSPGPCINTQVKNNLFTGGVFGLIDNENASTVFTDNVDSNGNPVP